MGGGAYDALGGQFASASLNGSPVSTQSPMQGILGALGGAASGFSPSSPQQGQQSNPINTIAQFQGLGYSPAYASPQSMITPPQGIDPNFLQLLLQSGAE